MVLAKTVSGIVERGTHVAAILGLPVLIQAKSSVEAADAIVCPHEFPIGESRPNAGLLTDVVTHTANGKMRTLTVSRIAVGNNQAR